MPDGAVMIHADKKEEVVIRYGYINEDDNIDATDALWILQSFVGLRTLDEEVKPAADVNLDGAIDASDALCVLQYYVGLRTELPVSKS